VDGRPVASSEYRIVVFSGAASEMELVVLLRDQGVSGKIVFVPGNRFVTGSNHVRVVTKHLANVYPGKP
jgi:hypothetical protein